LERLRLQFGFTANLQLHLVLVHLVLAPPRSPDEYGYEFQRTDSGLRNIDCEGRALSLVLGPWKEGVGRFLWNE
jgi:hypothetical protein